jgi:hypothetical protein
MGKTYLQNRIEMSVTGGLGYDSQTDFSKNNSIYSDGLEFEEVKNTPEGLNAHLREMTSPEHRDHGIYSGFIFSSNGRKINISTISDFRNLQMTYKNQDFIDKAYNAQAKRKGRIKTLINGLSKKIMGKDVGTIVEYLGHVHSSNLKN